MYIEGDSLYYSEDKGGMNVRERIVYIVV